MNRRYPENFEIYYGIQSIFLKSLKYPLKYTSNNIIIDEIKSRVKINFVFHSLGNEKIRPNFNYMSIYKRQKLHGFYFLPSVFVNSINNNIIISFGKNVTCISIPTYL